MSGEEYQKINDKLRTQYNLAVAKTHPIKNGKKVAFVTILVGGLNLSNPKSYMDNVVHEFVQGRMYNEYIDANLDNPWLRIIVEDINDLLD